MARGDGHHAAGRRGVDLRHDVVAGVAGRRVRSGDVGHPGRCVGSAGRGIETFISNMPAIYAGATLLLGPVFTAAMAGLLVWVFSMLMGGAATFKQVFAVVTHSGVISMLSGLFTAALVTA